MPSIKPLRLGITGGIGAGKSIISRIFQVLEIPVYDSDSRAKRLMYLPNVKTRIVSLFGDEAYIDGQLNRKLLAQTAFKAPEKLQQLNAIVHPAVAEDFSIWTSQQTAPYVLQEAALLFEAGSYKRLDKIITVTAPVDVRIKRVLARDTHRSEQDVHDIMDKQWPEEQKVEQSDYVIHNDEQHLIIPQVLKIHQEIISSLAEA